MACDQAKHDTALSTAMARRIPVELEGLQPLSYLKDQVEALIWLTCGKWQDLTLHSMICHVLQQGEGCQTAKHGKIHGHKLGTVGQLMYVLT